MAPGPTWATIKPPSAGPTALAKLNPALLSATAAWSSSGGTSSGMIACQAGALSAAPRPSAKVTPSSSQGVAKPASVSAARAPAATSIQVWVTRSNRRRSMMSASAPAGSARRNVGRLVAVWTSATITGEMDSVVIIQETPTLCMSVPAFEAKLAIHKVRNSPCRKGAQAGAADEVVGASMPMLRFDFLVSYQETSPATRSPVRPAAARRHGK
ncbi:hypothetical protein D3C72_1382740 [compost metagenome]